MDEKPEPYAPPEEPGYAHTPWGYIWMGRDWYKELEDGLLP